LSVEREELFSGLNAQLSVFERVDRLRSLTIRKKSKKASVSWQQWGTGDLGKECIVCVRPFELGWHATTACSVLTGERESLVFSVIGSSD
jgi:hypothetical protein